MDGEHRTTNLRLPPTRLIGRQAELARLVELLTAGQRLVTVLGPGGTGKTRTTLALADRMQDEFAGLGGVWWCDLASAGDLDDLCDAVASALGSASLSGSTEQERVQRLGAVMAARGPLLLVLDNFEQLVALAPQTVAVWLAEAPELRLVVTSREHLRLRGELRFELLPLTLPRPGQPEDGSEAVILFAERATALDPSFALSAATRPMVAELVTRLEGLPLAIELAASQVELLGLRGLLDNLHQRLDVWVADARDTEQRHMTLRSAVEWSWSLLQDAEQQMLAQCTVFRGGFSAEAAQGVLDASDGTPSLVLLRALRDKSLLRREEPEPTASAGESPRFSLFDAVRQFAAEHFASDDARQAARDRHGAWYLDYAEAQVAKLDTPEGPRALRELAQERANIEQAYEHASARVSDPACLDRMIRLALVLDTFAAIRGPSESQLDLLDRTYAAAEGGEVSPLLWLRLRRARAKARLVHGHTRAALDELCSAHDDAAEAAETALQAEILIDRGVHHHQQRQLDEAQALYDRAHTLAKTAGDRSIQGRALGNLGALHHDQHQLDEARAMYGEALELLREVGNLRLEAIHVCNRGTLELECGELSRARGHFEASRELLDRLGDRRLLAIVLGNLGTLEQLQGNLQAARPCHEQALAVLREVGDRRSEALSLSRLARANAALGWVDDADGCLAAADRLLGRFSDPLAAATVQLDRGFVELSRARREQGEARAPLLDSVRARISVVGQTADGTAPWTERCDDIRFAVRLLEQGLAELGQGGDASLSDDDARRATAIQVGPHGRWLQLPGEPAQDLRRRKAMRLILDRLVDEHRKNPGAGLRLEALLEAGWPGEKVMASAGANRVYVALTGLRKLGLRTVLLSRDDGYLLDPATPIQRVDVDWDKRGGSI